MLEDRGDRRTAMPKASSPRRSAQSARQRLAAQMAEIDAVLPGSIVVRHLPCGKVGCHCKADPPALHGPYIQWTRTVEGKTVTKYLSEEQFERYRPWFDNAKRICALVTQLEAASLK